MLCRLSLRCVSPFDYNNMVRRFCFSFWLAVFPLFAFPQTADVAEYSMYEVYQSGDATLIKAVKEKTESYVLRFTLGRTKAMNVVLGSKGDALVTLKTILDNNRDYRVLFKLDNPSNNTAGYFLKRSNSATMVRFYEGLDMNTYAEIPLKKLQRIYDKLSN